MAEIRQVKEKASPQFSNGPSCGLHMLYDIQENPKYVVEKVAKLAPHVYDTYSSRYVRMSCAFYCFSDTNWGYGRHLAQYIRDNDLGEIWETGERQNPNSGNIIRVWIWARDNAKLEAWCTKEGLKWQR